MTTAISPVLALIRVVPPPAVSAEANTWRGTAVVGITADEPVFVGHYPGFPIFPGMCVVECVHRAGLLTAPHDAGDLALAAMESVRFLSPVFPGDELRIELEWCRDGHDWRLTATASTDRGDAAVVRMRYRLDGAW
ncbi:3-hydroxyacyl-[acyl-carrier-protein] dehydratase [Lentzea fradiae]|uniref:3-hydroxyacyl-[acyl-carrier-protein] dehydratase n=1 Tax=Lentzea fradiae TaxID=200378 RepID=A0A1G7UW36_9PSEU|nr:MaoC/PaaZ C-terminal domain-containing protein [Lentzea fradiae]SDG50940.1 3-hydroxyacyl-[acyl-carrier-protein] dehydratase [Lentzea fradiae]